MKVKIKIVITADTTLDQGDYEKDDAARTPMTPEEVRQVILDNDWNDLIEEFEFTEESREVEVS